MAGPPGEQLASGPVLGGGGPRQQRPADRDGRFGASTRAWARRWAAAEWVMSHGDDLLSGDLSKDLRASGRGHGTVIALPLECRGQVDRGARGAGSQPSSAAPAIAGTLLAALRTLLEIPAIALDNALSLQRVEALSVTDDLTLLSNSRYLNQVLRQETKRATRSKRRSRCCSWISTASSRSTTHWASLR